MEISKCRGAFESEANSLGMNLDRFSGTGSYCEESTNYMWIGFRSAWNARPEPSAEVTEVLGMSIREINQMQDWFYNGAGKSFADFWREAFDAGIKMAIATMQESPK